jgi:hypothetical protein
VTEELEEPERASRSDARRIVVDHHGHVVGHAARREQVLDDPEKRVQRSGVGIDAADTEQVEVHGARQVVLAKVFDGPKIDEERRRRLELTRELFRRDEQRHRSETIS